MPATVQYALRYDLPFCRSYLSAHKRFDCRRLDTQYKPTAWLGW
jgi:hypothetical protein